MEPRPENEMLEIASPHAAPKEKDMTFDNIVMPLIFLVILGLLIWFFGAGSGSGVVQH